PRGHRRRGFSRSPVSPSHTVVTCPDGRAMHMQLAGDGLDGAMVDLSHLQGSEMRCTQAWAVTATSQTVELDFSTLASAVTPSSHCVTVYERTQSSLQCSVD